MSKKILIILAVAAFAFLADARNIDEMTSTTKRPGISSSESSSSGSGESGRSKSSSSSSSSESLESSINSGSSTSSESIEWGDIFGPRKKRPKKPSKKPTIAPTVAAPLPTPTEPTEETTVPSITEALPTAPEVETPAPESSEEVEKEIPDDPKPYLVGYLQSINRSMSEDELNTKEPPELIDLIVQTLEKRIERVDLDEQLRIKKHIKYFIWLKKELE